MFKCEFRVIVVFFINLPLCSLVQLDLINCGIDNEEKVVQGNVTIGQYPWLGILYYTYYGDGDETRAVTTVALIHKEFVIAVAADIGPMPKTDFRRNTRVLLGEYWSAKGRRVRNYVLHPEYGDTLNTVALIQLKDIVNHKDIKPLCPPPERLRDPVFYVVKFTNDYNNLQKQVIPVSHVPANLCRDFYVVANLYSKKRRPPHVACAVALDEDAPCVWDAGHALAARDVWGRWLILGIGVRGPGCGAPSRYLDMGSYFPWIEHSLSKFNQITITKLSKQKYVLRGGSSSKQRFGDCDYEEKSGQLMFRELIVLETDNTQFQFMTYNLTIFDNIEYKCLTLELTNASAVSEMRISHLCPRKIDSSPCHYFNNSKFDISVYIMFSDKCRFEMYTWGEEKIMTLLDPQEWKWEEGTYYEDFSLARHEYKGQTYMSEFGFEPLDEKMWIPEYDLWTTTEYDSNKWSSTTKRPDKDEEEKEQKSRNQEAWGNASDATSSTTSTTTTRRTKRYFRVKSSRTPKKTTSTTESTSSSSSTTESSTFTSTMQTTTQTPW